MFFSTHWVILVSSRFISGLAAGLAITIVSPLLSHISLTSPHPKVSSARGVIGTTNQLAIVLGIVSAQLVGLGVTGMKGDRRGGWRWVVGVSGLVAVVQLAAGWALKGWIEERKDLKAAGRPDIERRESGSDGKLTQSRQAVLDLPLKLNFFVSRTAALPLHPHRLQKPLSDIKHPRPHQ